MIKKISFWGSIGSIISAIALFYSSASVSERQTSYGEKSPNIHSNGDVNINYNSSQERSSYNYIEHPDGGGTLLIATPSLTNPKVICHPESGSKVEFLREKKENSFMVWVQVKVLSGTCQGKTGWIGKDNYRTHNS